MICRLSAPLVVLGVIQRWGFGRLFPKYSATEKAAYVTAGVRDEFVNKAKVIAVKGRSADAASVAVTASDV